MTRQENITLCECDRCDEKEYMTPDSPRNADWFDVKRVTSQGLERKALLCSRCYTDYKMLLDKEDTNYRQFMGDKGKANQ